MKRRMFLALALGLALLTASCGGGGGGSGADDNQAGKWDQMIWDQGRWE